MRSTTTYHFDLTITVEVRTAKAAYTKLCAALHVPTQQGEIEYATERYRYDAPEGYVVERSTEELWGK
jgi:hypothetical protein